MARENYENMSVSQLKELAKGRGIKGVSAMRKAEVINALVEMDSAQTQKEEPAKAGEEKKPAKKKAAEKKPAEMKPAKKKLAEEKPVETGKSTTTTALTVGKTPDGAEMTTAVEAAAGPETATAGEEPLTAGSAMTTTVETTAENSAGKVLRAAGGKILGPQDRFAGKRRLTKNVERLLRTTFRRKTTF